MSALIKPAQKFRTRRWSMIAYGVNPCGDSLELLKFTSCTGLAMIYHDRDVLADGSLKEPHWHILVYFANAVSLKGACAAIDEICVGNVLGEPVKDVQGAYQYLVHKNNPEKFQYCPSDIITWGDFEKLIAEDKKEAQNEQFLMDLLSLSRWEMACKYGRDYMKNYDSYRRFTEMIKEDMEIEEYVDDKEYYLKKEQ